MSSGAKISNNSLTLSWEHTAIAYQRERAAEGMILGVAIAESLAIPRNGVSKWTGLRVFGRSPLRFQFVPGLAIPGEHTHALLMTMQAIFQSRADHRLFGKSLKKRVSLYRSARPLSHAKARLLMASQSSDYKGIMGNPLIRAAAISLMVQGRHMPSHGSSRAANALSKGTIARDQRCLSPRLCKSLNCRGGSNEWTVSIAMPYRKF